MFWAIYSIAGEWLIVCNLSLSSLMHIIVHRYCIFTCRYRAFVVKSCLTNAIGGSLSRDCIVPYFSGSVGQDSDKLVTDTESHSLVTLDPKQQEKKTLDHSLKKLRDTDPFLVFLCYRGFNHIAGKIQSGMVG